MAQAVLAIDQGTTGSTVLVVSLEGKIIGRGYSEFKQYFPRPGWVEHDPDEIWRVTSRVIRSALDDAGVRAKDLAAVGITNQRETALLWDRKTGKPVHRAIVWQCRRTAGICDRLKARGLAGTFQKKTGLVIDAYFSGTKIKWLLDNIPGLAKRARSGKIAFGTIDSWLIYKLTGNKAHVTDYTNASRTLIFNIRKKIWDKDLLKILGIPPAVLPEVRPSSGEFGRTDCPVLPGHIPITGVAGDQQAALFGQAGFELGLAKNTYGTGCFLLVYLGDRFVKSGSGLVTTIACDPEGKPAYALEGSIFITGAAVQWLRDQLKLIGTSAESERLARNVEDTHGVYMVPAFVGLGAPYWDQHARGAILGLSRGAGRDHIIRATLESIAYQTRDLLLAMKKDLKAAGVRMNFKELRVDGGASSNDFLMQFQADILNLTVDRPQMVETTALGAAYLAGLAVGVWRNADEIKALRRTEKKFKPKMKKPERDRLYKGWLEAVARVKTF